MSDVSPTSVEFFGYDLQDERLWGDFATVVDFERGSGVEIAGDGIYEVVAEMREKNPEAAFGLLKFLWEHESEDVQTFAFTESYDFLELDTGFPVEIILSGLSGAKGEHVEDHAVRYSHDVFERGVNVERLDVLSLPTLATLIREYKAAKQRFDARQETDPTD